MAIMTNKKIIASILAALMLASMALPASAADLTTQNIDNGSGGNTTDVVLNYLKDEDPASDNGAFTITVPAQIDLDAEANGNDGVTFTGTGAIDFEGAIGQNDKVVLNVSSDNGYHLMDGDTEVAGYKVDFTTDDDNGIDIQTAQVKTGDDTKTISWNYAKAFQGEASIDMEFSNDEANTIFGKGEYKDTLTFDYEYESADDNNNTNKTIVCNNKNISFDIDEDGNVIVESLEKYATKDGNYIMDLEIEGRNTKDEMMYGDYSIDFEVKNGEVASYGAYDYGDFNYYASMNECNANLRITYWLDEDVATTDVDDTFWGFNSMEF